MPRYRLKPDAPVRSVNHVGPGDFILAGGSWRRIQTNSAFGVERPRSWEIRVEEETTVYGMFGVERYAKAEDLELV